MRHENRILEALAIAGDNPARLKALVRTLAGLVENGWVSFCFAGPNCNDVIDPPGKCHGWDGFDERCSCGNRRVSWEWDEKRQEWEAWAD